MMASTGAVGAGSNRDTAAFDRMINGILPRLLDMAPHLSKT